MSTRSLFALLIAFVAALPALGQKPADSRSSKSRSDDPDGGMPAPREVGGKTLDQWRKDLLHPDASVRTEAIRVLPAFRKDAAAAVPDVLRVLLHDGDASPRVKAAMSLNMMFIRDTDTTAVVKALGKCIGSDPQAVVRYEAALTLKRFGRLGIRDKEEREAITGLVASVGSGATYELRDICIEELIIAGPDPNLGPETRVTEALLLRASIESTTQVRLRAIMALGALGRPQDPRTLARVINTIKLPNNWTSSHKSIRIWSHVALMSLEEKVNEKYLQTVAEYLSDKERDTRVHAVAALGALEDKAHDYVDAICKMMRREQEVMVLEAGCIALGQMGDKGELVLSTLINQTENEKASHVSVVLAACKALENIGVTNKEVMDALNKVLEHKSLQEYQRDMVAKMIKDIHTPKAKEKKKNQDRELNAKTGSDKKRR